jgi:hypothetical protein
VCAHQLTPACEYSHCSYELAETRAPENCLYTKTRDGYHLWRILFPKDHYQIDVGCASDDSVGFTFSEDLAHYLAKYATIIEWSLDKLPTARKGKLSIAVYEEVRFKEHWPKDYSKGVGDAGQIGEIPILMSWREGRGEGHMKIAVTEKITTEQPRARRLYYALCGVFDSLGGLEKPIAAQTAAQLFKTLE